MHDHKCCITTALDSAETLCERQGITLTELRRKVLEIVWRNHEAIKAYDILGLLGSTDKPAKPPTVYRTLQFLQKSGLIHRIESLNAYVGCPTPYTKHKGEFFICTNCGLVKEGEFAKNDARFNKPCGFEEFLIQHSTVEHQGICPNCQL